MSSEERETEAKCFKAALEERVNRPEGLFCNESTVLLFS